MTRWWLAVLAGFSVVFASAVAAATLSVVHARTCASQNKDLAVLRNVLTTMYLGPHALNSPADVARRTLIYHRQIRQIEEAICH